jgi:U3 small nucleolar RNA-associated protein 10
VALRAVIISAVPTEDSALAAVLPKLVDGLKGPDTGVLNEILSLLELST